MIAPDAQLQPPSIIVPSPKDGSPQIFLGIVVHGSNVDASRLETAAKAAGLHAGRPKTEDGSVEVMVFFDANTSSQTAYDFVARVSRGEFGIFQIETMLVPPSAVKKTN